MTEHRTVTHRQAARHVQKLRRQLKRELARESRIGRVALHPPYSATEKLWMIGSLIFVALIFAYFGWQFAGRGL